MCNYIYKIIIQYNTRLFYCDPFDYLIRFFMAVSVVQWMFNLFKVGT